MVCPNSPGMDTHGFCSPPANSSQVLRREIFVLGTVEGFKPSQPGTNCKHVAKPMIPLKIQKTKGQNELIFQI